MREVIQVNFPLMQTDRYLLQEEFGSFKPSDEEEYIIIQKPAKTPVRFLTPSLTHVSSHSASAMFDVPLSCFKRKFYNFVSPNLEI